MILWTIKLLTTIRRAIAGRKYPHQLAWAVAFGLLLGVVPHGNLLAIGLLVLVLSLKLNHAMAALTAIGASFLANKLDPYSHQIGDYVLTHPQVIDAAQTAWSLPLVPWTNLNNTVVMGSLIIGVAALLPVFMLTYPVFRLFSPKEANDDGTTGHAKPADVRKSESHPLVLIDQGHAQVPPPRRSKEPIHLEPKTHDDPPPQASDDKIQFVEIPPLSASESTADSVTVETRINVIRMKESSTDLTKSNDEDANNKDENEPQPMDEALNYLLRQLRDSQTRKAA